MAVEEDRPPGSDEEAETRSDAFQPAHTRPILCLKTKYSIDLC